MESAAIRQDLRHLAGPDFGGRLSGTEGARRAAAYLEEALWTMGAAPAGDDGFYQPLEVPASRLGGPVRLITGSVLRRHRSEFGEAAHISAGGFVRSNLLVVRDGDETRPADLAGRAVLIPKRPGGFDLNATVSAAAELGVAALLVEWGEPRWFHKTVFGSAENRIPVLRIRESLAAELALQDGLPMELDLPLTYGRLLCRNVLGLLPGTDPTLTVALTAHYDHVGDDPGGERFPGALDNASGVATLLAVARALAARTTPLPFNVLVGFLTGEESGLWGAKHLAAHPPLPLAAVINVDGIGLEWPLRSVRLGYPGPGEWLADMAAEVLQQHGTEVQWITGTDDSAAFQRAGLPALGLGQMPTQSWSGGYHTPDDSLDALQIDAVRDCAEKILSLLPHLTGMPLKSENRR